MQRIRDIREEASLRQEDVAKVLGIKRSTYTSYEIERDTIPINHLNKLCNYFNISIDYALGLSNKVRYNNEKDDINQELLIIRLKYLREKNNLTQKDIANILNISRSTWTGYEYGKYQIPTLLLYDLCLKYHSSMDYILGKIDEEVKVK